MKSPDLAKILQGIRGRLPALSRLNNLLSRKTASLIVVDISSGLKLANVFLRAQPSISALKEECPGGENKEAAILKSLQAFLADNNLRNKKAVLNPALDEIYLKRLSVPVMARQELAQAIKWQIKDELPFDINKAVMDFAVVGETVSPEGAKAAEVICAAVPEEKIRQQVLLLRQAGLECLTVNITAFGYGRIIENYFKVL